MTNTIVLVDTAPVDAAGRHDAATDLQIMETKYREFVEGFPGLIVTMNMTGEVDLFSGDVLQYFGKTREALRGWQLNDAVHPDDLPRVITACTESVQSGEPYSIEYRLRRADGVYRWFRVRAVVVLYENDQNAGRHLVLTDIDDLKRAESELREAYGRLAEAQRLSKTGSFITDLLADERDWSDEAIRIFEFDPATKVTGAAIRGLVHPEDLSGYDAALERAAKGVDCDLSYRIITSAGNVKHLHAVGHMMGNAAGRPVFIGAIQDVTERKVTDEALNLARSELANVARITTLSALTASITHEVNQPLSGIITNAGACLRMLSADSPNLDGARETARRMIRDGNRASDVITRLHALFSNKEFALEPLDLNEATREVIALSKSELQRDGVIIQAEFGDDLPNVSGDRVQLQQVILNLLRNASDAMAAVDDRPRRMTIRTEPDEEDRVRLSVHDVGAGLNPILADKLFVAFHSTKKDGMGIGLAVSRSIVESHHGRLWATPNDGPGVTFSFSIPRERGDSTNIRRSA